MNKVIPAEMFPPGDFVREELEAREWTQADLAEILGVSLPLVNEIINGKRRITPETAKALGHAFGTDPQFWLNLESAYQLWKVRPNTEDAVARRAKLYAIAPVREMIRRNWIEPSNSVDLLEKRVLDFFGIKTLEDPIEVWPHAASKSTPYASVNAAQRAWLFRAMRLGKAVNAASFSEVSFGRVLRALRPLLFNPEDIRHVPRVLAEGGIRFVVVEHLEQTRLDGACLWLNPRAPIIALSLRYDRIDFFWFHLLHELGHVKRRDGLEQYTPVDEDLVGDILSMKDKPPAEVEASKFASEYLVPQNELEDFINRVRPLYSTRKIIGFAAVHRVHPGIVVGQLHHKGEITFAHSRKMLMKVRTIATQSALTDGWGHTPPAGL